MQLYYVDHYKIENPYDVHVAPPVSNVLKQ